MTLNKVMQFKDIQTTTAVIFHLNADAIPWPLINIYGFTRSKFTCHRVKSSFEPCVYTLKSNLLNSIVVAYHTFDEVCVKLHKIPQKM